jgi:hypothetical protein
MADNPPTAPDPGDEAADTENCQDYAGAMRTISAARGLFLLLLVVSLLLQVGIYCISRWTNVLAPTPLAEQEIASPSADTASGTVDLEEVSSPEFGMIYYAVELVMPLAEFVGQVSCGALVLCYLLAANVALSGRLGGVRGTVSAFFWMVVLLALLFPWDRWLGDLRGQVQIPGVYFTFDEVTNLPDEFPNLTAEVVHYVRFLGYPLLAFIIALVGDRRYAKGYRLAQRQIEARLSVRRL